MATSKIVCPQCQKTFKGKDDLEGKRIRCPGCGASFVVPTAGTEEDVAAALMMAGDAAAALQKKPPVDDDDVADANPYGVTTIPLGARCPNCANPMESEDAVICLYCGYNVQTRKVGQTKKVLATTGGDWAARVTPGIACVVGILLLALNQIIWIFWLDVQARGTDSFIWNIGTSEAWRWWMTCVILGMIWGMGQFAFKRLIVEPTPAEIELD
jgi:DNA-directed RNA polymerase subunit RPC12/RpoP